MDKNEQFKPTILGLPVKDFLAPWIAFWGLLGVFLGVVQVQKQISNQDNQLKVQQEQFEMQIKKQNEQLQLQQEQLHNTRFSSGVELLGNEKESVRIGGAYNLYFLAMENNKYLNTVCYILCAHIRTITNDKNYQEKYKDEPSIEIQTFLHLLFRSNQKGDIIFDNYRKDLRETFLSGAQIPNTKLTEVYFNNAILTNVNFRKSKFINAHFDNATLYTVVFSNTKLNNVTFYNTKLTSVNFSNAELIDVNFEIAQLKNCSFKKTVLEKYSVEEITQEGCSLKLTKINQSSQK